MTVTAAAMPIVRPAILRYVPLEWRMSLKLLSVQTWTILPVNASTCQKAEMNSAPSAPT